MAQEFASNSPLLLAQTIFKICHYLEEGVIKIYQSINWEIENFEEEVMPDISTLKDTDSIIRLLGEHLRYIDGAVTRKLPWSIIKPVEKLAQSIIPGISFMFRPQWKYNYSVVTDDLRKFYYVILSEFEDIVERPIEDDVFTNFKEPFHIISFPSIERKNILLHCLIGHELGHLIIKKYKFIDEDLKKNFTKRIDSEVKKIVMDYYPKPFDELDMFTRVYAREEVESSIRTVLQIWKRGLEEILSDIIGALIFGPAMLFSMYELSLQKELDHKPDYRNYFYPPWRYRLREIIEVLQRPLAQFFPIPAKYFPSRKRHKKINSRFELIKNLTEEEYDKQIIKEDPLVRIAYREIEKDKNDFILSTNYFKNELMKKVLVPTKLFKDIEHLVIRVENGLPPNAIEHSVENRRPATLVEIINAAWLYKISWEKRLINDDGELNHTLFEEIDTLNRLTLKAIEFSDIETEYKKKGKKIFQEKRKIK
ncbi:MAG: hypothetical protein GTO45_32705 [Candidatus Aminicenantes bacterium]|nr:hypothetical protein [Candidatus Aminicenantes bacterium]NIM83512.1 hypothetical protein [Candidatus Aminicenantes bacterium]NIN22901.1 hypothetical protein [Candidatus Aminicenantes bacterium]NIN46640.1 hypothetical protein [Candidatus Aminicenantes bacterium]NIN89543.1 hypothetical protein [Candidatus Aminicenantes bacterium]